MSQPTGQQTTTDDHAAQRDGQPQPGDHASQRDGQQPTGQQREPLPASAARSANGQRTFTQGDLDRAIQSRLADQKKAHERELQEALDRAGKSELDAAQLDVEKYKRLADEAEQQARATILEERIIAMVADSEVKKERRDRLASMIDKSDLAEQSPTDQRKAIATQISGLLDEMPEWKASSVPGSAGGQTRPPSSEVTLDAFRSMGAVERGDLLAKDPQAYRDLVQSEAQAAWRS